MPPESPLEHLNDGRKWGAGGEVSDMMQKLAAPEARRAGRRGVKVV